MKNYPLVSIIINTKNEEKNIINCLASISLQTYPRKKIEIIVVDNNSKDKTKEFAKKYTRYVFNHGPERSAQRNFGMINKARGEYVMFLDADMILSSIVIEKAVDKLGKNNLVACYIPEIVLGNSFWNKVRRFERSFYDGTVIDGLRFFRRNIFIKAGGFDEKLTAFEDWDLDKRIKRLGKVAILEKYNFEEITKKLEKTKLTKKAFVYHNELDFKLGNYLTKKRNYAKNLKNYISKWDKNDPDIKKQFGLSYRYFGVFIQNQKWKRIVRHPILTFGVLILKFLIGVAYVRYILKF